MFLKSWSYPRDLRLKQVLWVGWCFFMVGLFLWYSQHVSPPAGFVIIGWGVVLILGLWSVFSTPLWIISPRVGQIRYHLFFRFFSWGFHEVRFLFFPLEKKTGRGKSPMYTFSRLKRKVLLSLWGLFLREITLFCINLQVITT